MSRLDRILRAGAAITAVVFVVPLAGLVWAMFREPAEAAGVLRSATALRPFGRSLLVGVTSSALAVVLGVGTAWTVARSDMPGRRTIATLASLPLAIPSFAGAFAFRFALGSGGLVPWIPRLDGLAGATVVLALFSFPYVTLPVLARLLAASPAMEDSARLLGKTPRRVFVDVVWPQIRPAVASGALLVFLYALSDFGAVAIMRYDTVTRVIFSARLADPTEALTLGVLLAITAILASTLATRRGVDFDRTDAAAARRYPLGRWRIPVTALMATLIVISLFAPISAFAVWWLRGSSGQGLAAALDAVAGLGRPLLNTTVAGVSAAVVTSVALIAVAREAGRDTLIGRAASGMTAATYALPGVLLAAAVVFVVVRAPEAVFSFYQTFPLLILAYLLKFGAYSVRSTSDALAELPRRYGEVAATLGASPVRRFRSVELPLVLPAVVAGAGLVLMSVMKELPITLLLAPLGFDTLATRLWNTTGEGFLADAGLAALALVALSGVLTWFLVLRRTIRAADPKDGQRSSVTGTI